MVVPLRAQAGSLTIIRVGPEPQVQPGPPILYAAPASAPQLENSGVWHAAPILVSGISAYRGGEFLYQDYLYDDHGARQQPDPNDRRTNLTPAAGTPFNSSFSLPNGTYSYPSNPAYGENAADLVELRVKPLVDATAFRVTLNTMHDPLLTAFSIALGGTPGTTHPFPHGANVVAPADYFLTVHRVGSAMGADLVRAGDGAIVATTSLTVLVDAHRRQIEVRVPHSAWQPAGTVRLAAGTGLWDGAAGRYLVPQAASSATMPGGAGTAAQPAAFFNVAFRYREPWPQVGASGFADDFNNPAWWRDRDQGNALTAGDISQLFAEVDFGKLLAGETDDSAIPTTGSFSRILASHFEPHQGIDYGRSCYAGDLNCQYQGQLQPYTIYVPHKAVPPSGFGMTLLLHANATNYTEYFGTRNQSELGERGPGSIVITPQARDPAAGDYTGYGTVDVFEVWADVNRLYHVDPTWTAITGYSMGGFGTYKIGESFPDLFGRALAMVGSPGGIVPVTPVPYVGGGTAELPSLRNLPMGIWDVTTDELNPNAPLNATALEQLGYRYDFLLFPGDHFTLLYNDEFAPAAAFLGTEPVHPNPAHVTYVYAVSAIDGLGRPWGDFPKIGLVADHAYWLSGLRLANGGEGTVDALSHGFGIGDPKPSGKQVRAGALAAGALFPTLPYVETYQTWGVPPVTPRENRLEVKTQNVSALTIDVARAGVDCNAKLDVTADVPLTLTLAGCDAAGANFGPLDHLPDTAAPAFPQSLGLCSLAGMGLVTVARRRRRRARE